MDFLYKNAIPLIIFNPLLPTETPYHANENQANLLVIPLCQVQHSSPNNVSKQIS